jgi:SulP family sulfate permease
LLIVRFDSSLFFGNIEQFTDALNGYRNQKGTQLKTIILNCESINTIDSTALSALEEMLQDAKKADILLLFSSVKGPIRDRLLMSPIIRDLSADHFFMSIQDAVLYYDVGRTKDDFPRPHRAYTLQTNTPMSKL